MSVKEYVYREKRYQSVLNSGSLNNIINMPIVNAEIKLIAFFIRWMKILFKIVPLFGFGKSKNK